MIDGLGPAQWAHAQAMIAEVQAYGMPERAAVIVIETALVESEIQVLANPNVPESMSIPHDGVGYDHASVGPLQQQVPMWGTAHDCMDPAISTRKFLDRLVRFDWASIPTGEAAQRVQVSAFPDRYQQREAEAIQIVNSLWEDVVTPADRTAIVETLMQWDMKNGPGTAPYWAVIDNMQKAIAECLALAQQTAADVAALKTKSGVA